ncbi:MAG: dienelactone hydrolase family protein [Acidimicrobiales bacterium]
MAEADVVEEVIDAATDDGEMAVVVKAPSSGARATVVIFQDAPGIRGSLHDFARNLAGEGYRVVMPDLHHRFGRMIGYEASEATPEARAHISQMLGAMTDAQIQHDLDAALAATGSEAETGMGCVGFCLGARAVYQSLRRLPDAFVAGAMWHPSFLANDVSGSPHLTAATLDQPLYIGIGTADKVQSIEMHRPFFDAVEPLGHVEVRVFDGADHGYTWPTSPNYHAEAATVSWERTLALFDATLG